MRYLADYHKNKTETEFYKILIDHIECEPTEALLIDNDKKNVKIAESLGFRYVHFYYIEKLLKDLRKFNIELN